MDPMDVLTRATEPPDAVVRYADHTDGVIDLFLPTKLDPTRQHPLLVALHGGFWHREWDRTHLRPMAHALVDRGWVVATPEYRRGAGSWPDTRDDVATALDVVADLVESVAPGAVDPNAAYTLTGHSAGGHLALWGGLRAGPERVRRIVALAPVADLEAAARSGMGEGAAIEFLGGTPDDRPDAYAEANPMRMLPGRVPVVILHGTDDHSVPVEASRAVATALMDSPTVSYIELADVDHFAVIDPLSAVFVEAVLPQLSL